MSLPLDVEGPIRAEIFTLASTDSGLLLTGPCGAAPWLIEVHDREHPLESVRRIVDDVLDDVWLVHSTSWRWEAGALTLTFVVVIGAGSVGDMDAAPVERIDLARGAATAAPTTIGHAQVLEHGLRHLAWLAREDDVVMGALTPEWHDALVGYVPEPFRQLDKGGSPWN